MLSDLRQLSPDRVNAVMSVEVLPSCLILLLRVIKSY